MKQLIDHTGQSFSQFIWIIMLMKHTTLHTMFVLFSFTLHLVRLNTVMKDSMMNKNEDFTIYLEEEKTSFSISIVDSTQI